MKKGMKKSKILDVVEEGLYEIGKVKPVLQTVREFNKLKYEDVKEYTSKDIIHLRKTRLRLSQSSFACAINARLSTVQKWERGVRKPAPYANRLFQILERKGLSVIEK